MSSRKLTVELTGPQFSAIMSALATRENDLEDDVEFPSARGELVANRNAGHRLVAAWREAGR